MTDATDHDRPASAMTSVELLNLFAAERDASIFSGVTNNKITIVAALIMDAEGRVLTVRKRGTSSFMQPGGKLQPGENHLTALARELQEELGCALLENAVHISTLLADAANEPGFLVEANLYRANISGEPAAQAEIDAIAWIDPNAPGDLPLAPLTREFVLPLARRPHPR
jgi:8-oxo-dGTP diphosphatase